MSEQIQNILKLAQQIKDESTKALHHQLRMDLNSKVENFVFEQISKHADDILSLLVEKHTFEVNYWHPEVLAKFPEKTKEGGGTKE